MKRVILIRHCRAIGQESTAQLTADGVNQAFELKEYLLKQNIKPSRIVSSPFTRAVETIKPLANKLEIDIELDKRLEERILSERPLEDWMRTLERTFQNFTLTVGGGESSIDAQRRAIEAVKEQLTFINEGETLLIVTHGNLMTLVLNYYDTKYGYNEWKSLSNPDVFEILSEEQLTPIIKRIWK